MTIVEDRRRLLPRCIDCGAVINAHGQMCARCEHGAPDPERTHAAFRARAAAARADLVEPASPPVAPESVSGRGVVSDAPEPAAASRRRRGGRRR